MKAIRETLGEKLDVVYASLKEEQAPLIELAKTKHPIFQVFFYLGLTFITILLIILKALFPSPKQLEEKES